MSAISEALSDEEMALACILMDSSGIDLAEFLWQAHENEEGCFRAWPFQWAWYRCNDPLQIDQCARAVGKSLGIKLRMFAFPFAYPGQEAAVTAPELIHLEPIVHLVEEQFDATRLGREIRKKLPTHRPFEMQFKNGARILGRIPQRDGKGAKGLHPLMLEHDEASDYPEPGWKELIETLKRGQEGATWRAHGVTRGMRDSFYKFSQHGQDDPPLRPVRRDGKWTVHRMVAMCRPNWTDEERTEKIMQYGSKEDPDYRRNVHGAHGDSQSPIFVLHRLMRCVDDDPSSDYNQEDYWHFEIKDTELDRKQSDISDILLMDVPSLHSRYKTIWMGADIGFTLDPTEILIAAEVAPTKEEVAIAKRAGKAVPEAGTNRLRVIGRVTLKRIGEPAQADVIVSLIDHYKPQAFAMDSTGVGLPLFQQVQRRMQDHADRIQSARARKAAESIKGYNFSSKILVDFDETVELPDRWQIEDKVKEAGIMRNVLEYSTDIARSYVDDGRMWLPWDTELIDEMRGQTFSYSKSERDAYGRRRIFSAGSFHAFDALRMLVLGHKQNSIEAFLNTKPDDPPVVDIFMEF